MKKYLLLILTLFCAATITATAQGNGQYVTWKYSSKTLPNGSVELFFEATIPDGFRLYSPYNPEGASKPLMITLDKSDLYTTDGKVTEIIKPEEHYEEIFDATEKYFKKAAKFKIVIKPKADKPFDVTGALDGQVCNDEWFCAMVMDNFKISVTPKPKEKADKPATDNPKKEETKPAETPKETKDTSVASQNTSQNNADSIVEVANAAADTIQTATATQLPTGGNSPTPPSDGSNNDSLWWVFAIAFLAGLAAIFTPCVFPMIPMTVTFFLKDKSGKGKWNALIYGVSIILLYTLPVAILI
nr:hypothetical protein [Bacteroidales bacterium]